MLDFEFLIKSFRRKTFGRSNRHDELGFEADFVPQSLQMLNV